MADDVILKYDIAATTSCSVSVEQIFLERKLVKLIVDTLRDNKTHYISLLMTEICTRMMSSQFSKTILILLYLVKRPFSYQIHMVEIEGVKLKLINVNQGFKSDLIPKLENLLNTRVLIYVRA